MGEINRAIIDSELKYIESYNLEKLKELFNKTTGSNVQTENFIKAQEYAKSKNGKCLSKSI